MAEETMENDNHILLQQEIYLYPSKRTHTVLLTRGQILIRQGSKLIETIHLTDVIGCHVLQEKKKSATTSYLCVFSYPIKKRFLLSGKYRKRVTRTFSFNAKRTYEENLKLCELWKMTIKRLIRGENINSSQDIESGSLPKRNLLVLVNPFSGRKQAMHIYKHSVRTMFTEAEIKHTVRKTEYPGHAKEIAYEMVLKEWDGIVVISGDGLVHEVLNGLMERSDWRDAIKTPVGVIPGGSGNALAAAAVFHSTELHKVASDPVMCTFEVCRGGVSPLDLVGVEYSTEDGLYKSNAYSNGNTSDGPGTSSFLNSNRREIYSFMDMAIGLIADIDIESESLRCFGGELRNTIYAILLILKMRHTSIQLSYLPCNPGTDFKSPIKTERGAGDEIVATESSALNQKNTANERGDSDAKIPSGKLSPKKKGPIISRETPLPPLDCDLPENWVTEEGDFVLIMANYITHVAHNALTDRSCKLDDGKIYLHKLGKQTSRCFLIDIWDKFDEGSGVTAEMKAEDGSDATVHCSAFRITPLSSPSKIMTVDGERVPYGPMQFRILPGLARVMVSKPTI